MRVSALIACVLVAAVSDSVGELSASTYIGLAVGVAFLLGVERARAPRPARPRWPTRLESAKAQYVHGVLTLDEFESRIGELLKRGDADESSASPIVFAYEEQRPRRTS
jgi:hypothetical protein